jgi:hypothetical protein
VAHCLQIREGDDIFRVGDDVFYIMDGPEYYRMGESFVEDEYICGECSRGERRGMDFIECDYCLRAYHNGCLKSMPVEGDSWKCPMCEMGEALPDSPPRCNLHLFLRTEGIIGVGRIVRLWRCDKQEVNVDVQDYQRPEQEGSHLSIARRLHFTSTIREFAAGHLIGHVTVANDRDDFEAADTEDVFLCETRYNDKLGVYERLEPPSEVLPSCGTLTVVLQHSATMRRTAQHSDAVCPHCMPMLPILSSI